MNDEARELEEVLEKLWDTAMNKAYRTDSKITREEAISQALQAILKDYVRRERVEKYAEILANNCFLEGQGTLDTTIVKEIDNFLNALHSEGKEK